MNALSWGGLRLYYQGGSTDIGRSLTVQSPARGNRHVLSDRGATPGPFDAEIIFGDMPNETEDFEARYQRFRVLNDGSTRLLVHPRHGAYLAKIGSARMSENSSAICIMVSVQFLPEEQEDPVLPLGPGASSVAGPEAVDAVASQLDTELADLDVDADSDSEDFDYAITASCSSTVTAWSDDEAGRARVEAELAAQTADLDTEIEALELGSLDTWATFRTAILLRGSLRDAAAAVVSSSPRLFVLEIDESAPLISICLEQYGATDARRAMAMVVELNGILNPLWIDRGTMLKMPVEV